MIEIDKLKVEIEKIWDLKRQNSASFDKQQAIKSANKVIDLLDNGELNVVELRQNDNFEMGNAIKDKWIVNDWVKKGILLSFLNENILQRDNVNTWFDKCANKFSGWSIDDFRDADIRVVNGAFVRKGAFFDKGCIVMPSFVNIGANIGENTMIDSMTTIGSCAKIGKKCHISSNVCIGGVLEPLQASPVIIEDNCFVGAGSSITEGIVVGEGSVIASNVSISSGVKIINRQTGEIVNGFIPPYSVVVGGSYNSENNVSINCAVIIKIVTPELRKKVSINDLLR